MTLSRLALGVAAATLFAGGASAHDWRHDHHRHHHHLRHYGVPQASVYGAPYGAGYDRQVPYQRQEAYRGDVAPNLITNGPVPDTPENRARYGPPMSRGGQMTAPAGD